MKDTEYVLKVLKDMTEANLLPSQALCDKLLESALLEGDIQVCLGGIEREMDIEIKIVCVTETERKIVCV